MNNKTLILLIVVVAAITVIVVSWRTPSTSETPALTPTPTATATPTVTDPFAATPSTTTTATPTPTVTTTATATPTPTPTTTTATGTFNDIRDMDYIFGGTEQTVGSSVYFIDDDDAKIIRKGSSTSDAGAQAIFTSDTAGEVANFYVNGNYLYVATKRDGAIGTSKLQRVALSSSSKAKLYEFSSSKYEITQFAINKNNDAKAGFYIGLGGVNSNASPAGMYIENYSQKWIKTFTGVDKTALILKLAPTTDETQLVGVFLKGSEESQAYIDLD
ncbi:hypothetical protein IT418_00595 [bacterium]|nr:hypothetical protein [bacterium]